MKKKYIYSPEQTARRNELQRIRRAENPERTREHERLYRQRHPDRIKLNNQRGRERLGPEYWKNWNRVRKLELIEIYGGKCVCCGETEPVFLSIDHINGGGHQHRKSVGNKIYTFLKANNWPKDEYRLLCMNCQFGFMHNGVCPHQEK